MNPLYATIMLAAVATALVLSRRRQAPLPLSIGQRAGIVAGAFCGAMVGAKLPFLLADLPGLASGHAWLSDGKTIVTGLVGGYFGVELAKWALEIRVKTGDSFAVPVAASVAVGRLGCFAAGCCYGAVTRWPWGVDFGDGLPRHPTQLYEAAFHGAMALALVAVERRGLWPGQRIKGYLLAYFAYRFVSEWLRPEPVLAGHLTGYQWASLVLLGLFGFLWWSDCRRATSVRHPRAVSEKGRPE